MSNNSAFVGQESDFVLLDNEGSSLGYETNHYTWNARSSTSAFRTLGKKGDWNVKPEEDLT